MTATMCGRGSPEQCWRQQWDESRAPEGCPRSLASREARGGSGGAEKMAETSRAATAKAAAAGGSRPSRRAQRGEARVGVREL